MKIKICGLTCPEEALYLKENQVDFAGMVLFFPKSKRNITIEQAKKILAQLGEEIASVAVVVSPTLAQVREIEEAGFSYIQIHGTLSEEILSETTIPILKAFNVKDMAMYESFCREARICGYVFDAQEPGSGKSFDWSLVKDWPRDNKLFLLAGGLGVENVSEAIRWIRPDGVDVSSKVEYTDKPGKDPEKIRAFVKEARKEA